MSIENFRMSGYSRIFVLLLGLNATASEGKPNVLFLIVDDLRPEIPAYGKHNVQSPNIERLASEGVVFENAYANVPVCGASRASLMTGIRPTANRFVGYRARIDEDAVNAKTLFGYLKEHGYFTESIGKVVHFSDDSANGWSTKPWLPRLDEKREKDTGHRDYQLAENIRSFLKNRKGPAYEAADVPDNTYYDGKIADRAVASLVKLKQSDKPFFLAIGFLKPHLPFNAPKVYWDLYPEGDITLSINPLFPKRAPKEAWHDWGELRKYAGVPPVPELMPDDLARNLIHGYYASLSYSDAQIGKVLNALDELDLADNTLVFLFGDHGWSLGEHSLWAKHSPFDVATHTPLIVRVPGGKTTGSTKGLVEFIDIYPTVLDLLGLAGLEQLQGESFSDQLKDPDAPGKQAVYPRWRGGEVIKTKDFALTEWFDDRGQVKARMLFDHRNDRDETINLAEHPNYTDVIEGLHQQLLAMIASR